MALDNKKFDDLLDDFDGHIYGDCKDFFANFFETKYWWSIAQQLAETTAASVGDDYPLEVLLKILVQVRQQSKAQTPYRWSELRLPALHEAHKILILSDPMRQQRAIHAWLDVMAIGVVCRTGDYRDGFINLCRHAKLVFAAQPARLFLHGFHLWGNEMELWAFNRSGIYGSQVIDITKHPALTVSILFAYTLMSDEEVGVSPLLKEGVQGSYIVLDHEVPNDTLLEMGSPVLGQPKEDRHSPRERDQYQLYLENPPIFARVDKNITGDGLTCYKAKLSSSARPDSPWEIALKLKWSGFDENSEVDMMKLVNQKGTWGVLRLIYSEIVGRTKDLHLGLQLNAPRTLLEHFEAREDNLLSNSMQVASVDTGDGITDSPSVDNKILTCIAVWPLGKSLHRFKTVPELLHALHDAIKAHRALYHDGILHQDICPGNIIIPFYSTDENNSLPKGVLIDLDMAKKVSEPWRQGEIVGTPPFEAIGVLIAYLPNNPHTYRHDLESFFYTFLFLAICQRPVAQEQNQLELPPASLLRQWREGKPFDQANRKTRDMEASNFHRITNEFTLEFSHLKSFAENLRDMLFPERDGKIWTGTDTSPDGTEFIYGRLLESFEDVLSSSSL